MLCGVVVRGSLLVYFVQYILYQASGIISIFMMATTVAVIGSLFEKKLGSWMCKIRSPVWVTILSALAGLLFFVLPTDYWIPAFIVHIALNLLQGINAPLQWSMITDANNYCEWKTQLRISPA